MTKPEKILEKKIEAMDSFARKVRKEQTNDYYVTKRVGCLLEGYSPNSYRKVRYNQRDRIIWEVLERLDKPCETISDMNIWEYVNTKELLESATERQDSYKSKVIVTGIKVPKNYGNKIADPIEYAEKLIELSDVCPVFVSTEINDKGVLNMLDRTNITLINNSENLEYFLSKLLPAVYPLDTRSPKERHRDTMAEIMGDWRTTYLLMNVGAILVPEVERGVRELYRKN